MKFFIDWTNVPARERLSPKTIKHLETKFTKLILASRGKLAQVAFVRPEKMRAMNRRYAGSDSVTDVLSFRAEDGEIFPMTADEAWVGDLLLCFPDILKNAARQKIASAEELSRMLVHGALHCLGYDHALSSDRRVMFDLQEKIIHDSFE